MVRGILFVIIPTSWSFFFFHFNAFCLSIGRNVAFPSMSCLDWKIFGLVGLIISHTRA